MLILGNPAAKERRALEAKAQLKSVHRIDNHGPLLVPV